MKIKNNDENGVGKGAVIGSSNKQIINEYWINGYNTSIEIYQGLKNNYNGKSIFK